jgi:hypothetical protein
MLNTIIKTHSYSHNLLDEMALGSQIRLFFHLLDAWKP